MNHRHPIGWFSHYAREDAKISLSRQMHQETGADIWDIPGIKGLYIGDGAIVVAAAEEHPLQGSLIPTEIKRPDYKGTPVVVSVEGYSYHLTGTLDHLDDARDDSYLLGYQGRRGGGSRGGGGTVQGGTQIVCANKEYGTAGGVFIDKSNKQNITCSWHVIQQCRGSVDKGSGNTNQPQGAGKIATVGKNGCGCGGSSAGVTNKGWSEIGTYGLGTIANYDYAVAYPAIFGRNISDIPYIGRRPLDHHYFQRGGGGGGGGHRGGGGGRGGTFWLDDTACPLTVTGSETVLGLGKPKGFRRAVMKEKLSYRGVRSGTTKTFPVNGLNYTDRGGICGTCTDMVVCYPCPLPGDSGASYWGTDGFLVAIVTDGSNDKGGNNCTSYNCSMIHIPECLGLNIRGAVEPTEKSPTTTPTTTTGPSQEAINSQQKRLEAEKKAYFGVTVSVA